MPRATSRRKSILKSKGEILPPVSEKEWAEAKNPYAAHLLNVKKDSKRVCVFALPDKPVETANSEKVIYAKGKKDVALKAHCQTAVEMMQNVFQVLAKDPSKTHGIEVTFSMKVVCRV